MPRTDPGIAAPRLDAGMSDHSGPGDDFAPLSRDRMPVRSMVEDDLPAIIGIDRRLTGRERAAYFERKLAEVMGESGIRMSLIAEVDGSPAGFVMARVDFGEFGLAEPVAVLDTLGVDPDQAHHGIGHALLSQLCTNLATLQVETIRTMVRWDSFELLRFLDGCGFAPAQRIVLTKRVD